LHCRFTLIHAHVCPHSVAVSVPAPHLGNAETQVCVVQS
jgi:hypothetical protein